MEPSNLSVEFSVISFLKADLPLKDELVRHIDSMYKQADDISDFLVEYPEIEEENLTVKEAIDRGIIVIGEEARTDLV